MKNDLFGPVVEAFLANGGRYNLLDSAVLDLFNTILVVSGFLYTKRIKFDRVYPYRPENLSS